MTVANYIPQKKQNLSNLVCIKWIKKLFLGWLLWLIEKKIQFTGRDSCWPISSLFLFM